MASRGRLARATLCLWALAIGPPSVEAGITTIRIEKTEPLADGAAFGTAGAYERVTGMARGEVDPRAPRNAGIVNLDKAPRNTRGLVEYETDFYLLRPNEVAGIRLPDIAVPLGTHTGWNIYAEPFPEGELCDRDGSFAPFARTRAERVAAGDSRPSLEEGYGTSASYASHIETATCALV